MHPRPNAITAVAPELSQDPANTATLVQVLAQQKSGLHWLLTSGSTAFSGVDNLVTSQSANLGCLLHETADILSNIAQPANLTNVSQVTSPQAAAVRLVANLQRVDGVWKISVVTVLEGADPAGAGSASGSSGSNVPGQ